MDRGNHYELAFESYLQHHRVCYVAVDETRRAPLGDVPVKSLDFLVFGRDGTRLVVDVKGRRFPGGPPGRPRRVWECWSHKDDLDGLERWARAAGDDYRGLLVFAYLLDEAVHLPDGTPDLFAYRGDRYLFRAVESAVYREHMRPRSRRWETVSLSREVYRALVRPVREFTAAALLAESPF